MHEKSVLASPASDAGIVDDFKPFTYLATNPDLIGVFGADANAGLSHFLAWGFAEGRPAAGFNAFLYLAGNPDLIGVFGADATAAIDHYVRWGFGENRPTASFSPFGYLAGNPDLLGVYGPNTNAAIEHYVRWGFTEGRTTTSFDALEYVASNPDLIPYFGTNTGAAIDHYVRWGFAEGRPRATFNAAQYRDNYGDLEGAPLAAARASFIDGGFAQGRGDAPLVFGLAATAGDDVLAGNASANVLDGLGGNDSLTGGFGADQFVFGTALNAATNVDRVVDFTPNTDKLVLDHLVFTSLATGALAAQNLATTGTAQDANDFILYNSGTGLLAYDADGSGAIAAIPFATLVSRPVISAADFLVV